jgi:hypothetical protein
VAFFLRAKPSIRAFAELSWDAEAALITTEYVSDGENAYSKQVEFNTIMLGGCILASF